MAHVQTHPGYDFSPEEGVKRINAERTRSSMLALSIGVFTVFLFGMAVYFSFRGVPAPESPANAKPYMTEPYH